MQPTLLEIFSQIRDHRRAEGKLYPLPQILVFYLLAMLAGATSYRKMHEFIMAHFRRLSVLFPSKMLKAPCYARRDCPAPARMAGRSLRSTASPCGAALTPCRTRR